MLILLKFQEKIEKKFSYIFTNIYVKILDSKIFNNEEVLINLVKLKMFFFINHLVLKYHYGFINMENHEDAVKVIEIINNNENFQKISCSAEIDSNKNNIKNTIK